MRTVVSVVICFAAVSAQSALQQSAPPKKPPDSASRYSVDVDLVIFNVTVRDSQTRSVTGLTKKNFRVVEDGIDQDLQFVSAEDVPATVGLVLDNSGSMKSRQSQVAEAVLAFARASNPQDEMFTVHFNERVSMGLPQSIGFTSSIDQLRSALSSMHMEGKTALYDAIAKALTHLQQGSHPRKALVLVSDGGDNASGQTEEQVLNTALQSDATIYAIGVEDREDSDRNPKLLKQVSSLTGGEAFFPKDDDEISKACRRIADGIRHQYTLGFAPKHTVRDGRFRNVKVFASDNNGKPLRVHTRTGYVLSANPG